MIYATDLDRTIIFSSKFIPECKKEVKCIEYYNEKPISYICVDALMQFNKLMKKKELRIIPVTTRSVAQYQRIKFLNNVEYAITTNGGIILHNNLIFQPWKNKIDKIINQYKKEGLYNNIFQVLLNNLDFFEKEPRLVDDIFYFGRLKDNYLDNLKFLSILDTVVDKTKWMFTLQGLKFYIIPKEISKENALKYLKDYFKESELIVSGDGKLDKGFLEQGNYVCIPEQSEVLNYLDNSLIKYKLVPYGLEGTICLFNVVNNYIKN